MVIFIPTKNDYREDFKAVLWQSTRFKFDPLHYISDALFGFEIHVVHFGNEVILLVVRQT